MSYDVMIGGRWVDNYTYNLGAFFYKYIEVPGISRGLRSLDRLPVRHALTILKNAIHNVRGDCFRYNEEDEYAWLRTFDSPNGWGTGLGALLFLCHLAIDCAEAEETEIVEIG